MVWTVHSSTDMEADTVVHQSRVAPPHTSLRLSKQSKIISPFLAKEQSGNCKHLRPQNAIRYQLGHLPN